MAGHFGIIPMECPRCASGEIRTIKTNGTEAGRVTRQRGCLVCRRTWYTVELPVSVAVIGWTRKTGKSVPVLRVPVDQAVGKEAV